jgi:hypothetical protein
VLLAVQNTAVYKLCCLLFKTLQFINCAVCCSKHCSLLKVKLKLFLGMERRLTVERRYICTG